MRCRRESQASRATEPVGRIELEIGSVLDVGARVAGTELDAIPAPDTDVELDDVDDVVWTVVVPALHRIFRRPGPKDRLGRRVEQPLDSQSRGVTHRLLL